MVPAAGWAGIFVASCELSTAEDAGSRKGNDFDEDSHGSTRISASNTPRTTAFGHRLHPFSQIFAANRPAAPLPLLASHFGLHT